MRKFTVLGLAAWVVVPPILIVSLHASFLVSILLYLAVPSAYFSFKRPDIIPRAAAVSLLAMLCGAVLDYLAFLNNAWSVPTIFPFRLMQLVPLEDFLFVFFAAYVIVSGFDYFFPRFGLSAVNWRHLVKAGAAIVCGFVLFLIFIHLYPTIPRIPYYDAWLLLVAFVGPTAALLVKHPEYVTPLLVVVLFQLVAMLPYELVADALGFWAFPSSEYLGVIHLLGQRFPIEEFLEWMMFMAPAVLSFNLLVAGARSSRTEASPK